MHYKNAEAFARDHGFYVRDHQVIFTELDKDGRVVNKRPSSAHPATPIEQRLFKIILGKS